MLVNFKLEVFVQHMVPCNKIGPRQAILVLIAYASREGSGAL